jgi:deazaflavin-dependent oxidoreductase (nitroreductase family)
VGAEQLTNALRSTDEIELTVTGRRSGLQSTRPVWFVEEGASLYLVPVTGSDSDWYRSIVNTPAVRLSAGDAELSTTAIPIADQARVDQVVDRFREKYGTDRVTAYYPKLDAAVEVPLTSS